MSEVNSEVNPVLEGEENTADQHQENLLRALESTAISQDDKVKLLYSKSKVYVHPSGDADANIAGYFSVVEKAANDYLVAWTPEALVPYCDRESYVYLDSKPENAEEPSARDPDAPNEKSKRKEILVSLPKASTESMYAASIPLSSIHSVRVQPPSLSSWYGFLLINLKDGENETPLPFWFHDDESNSTMQEGLTCWGGDEVAILLETLGNGVWSTTEYGLLHLNPTPEELAIIRSKEFPDELPENEPSSSSSGVRRPQTPWNMRRNNDPLKLDPLLVAVKEAKWNILERFSKVTQFYRKSAAQILDHPLGRPLVPFLHPKIAALATSAPAKTVMDDFEGARLYLAKWAAGVAAHAKQHQRKGGANAGSQDELWEHSTEDDAGLGVWEILSTDDALPMPHATRTGPISVEEWLSFYDSEGRLTKSETELRRRVFEGGVENDIRPDVWKYFLGFWPWNSSENERAAVKEEKIARYHELKAIWSNLSPSEMLADAAFAEQKHRIEKDVVRTDRTVPLFAGEEDNVGDGTVGSSALSGHLVVLKEMLLTYNYLNTELGYVQGMSDLLSPIYAVMRDEVESFWCFAGIMERMERNFLRDQSGMRDQLGTLESLIRFMDAPLHQHLENADSLNLFCCFRWLLIWFKREFEFDKILRLWEVLLSDHLTPDMHLFVALAILEAHRDVLMDHLKRFDEILKYVNDLSGTIDLEETLKEAEVLYRLFVRRKAKLERLQNCRDDEVRNGAVDGEGSSSKRVVRTEKEEARDDGTIQLESIDDDGGGGGQAIGEVVEQKDIEPRHSSRTVVPQLDPLLQILFDRCNLTST